MAAILSINLKESTELCKVIVIQSQANFLWVFASEIFSTWPERWEADAEAKCIGPHWRSLTSHPESIGC